MQNTLAAMAAALLCAAAAGPAPAATLTAVTALSLPGASTGSVGSIGSTPSPNNDNAMTPANVVTSVVQLATPGTVQVEFSLANSGGTTEYHFLQTFANQTGGWLSGFTFELGYGLDAAFSTSGAADSLDFDTPDMDPAAAATAFALQLHGSDRLEWGGGSVAPGSGVTFVFSIDVPDNLSAFHGGGLNRFTLRQTPIATPVPEPPPLLLLSVGAVALALRGRSCAEPSRSGSVRASRRAPVADRHQPRVAADVHQPRQQVGSKPPPIAIALSSRPA